AIWSDESRQDEILQSQDLALARLKRRDFRKLLLGFIDQVRRSPRLDSTKVRPDFWDQYELGERLEYLRTQRPSIYEGLPKAPPIRSGVKNQ
ncbi:uncharacterized protein METZ01_LOCUS332548, partial [marine metagenome]